jgi:CRP/FNR family transcriptional regulator, cyclic AMP receptor protein
MIQEGLRLVSLFQDLDDDELAHVLMVGMRRRYAAGAVILAEGAAGGQLHVIQRGRVRIGKVVPGIGEEALAILGPSEFFGEIEFFDGAPASAQAVAHEDCEILAVPHGEIRALMASRPEIGAKFLWAFSRTLAARLRETNQRMASVLAISKTF